jgi:hypothetical protein
MSALARAISLIVLLLISMVLEAGQARAEASCNITQPDMPHYIDAATEQCRNSGSYPSSGTMAQVFFDQGFSYFDVSYAADWVSANLMIFTASRENADYFRTKILPLRGSWSDATVIVGLPSAIAMSTAT